jgi:hypothetical protein
MPSPVLISQLAPLVINAPTPRCGTTLVQRLLCSSSNALIFGELCAHDLEMMLNLYSIRAQGYQFHRQHHDASRAQTLNGAIDAWIPDLMPDIDGYVEAFGQAAFAGIAYCREYARAQGRPVWGFKYPGLAPSFLRLLQTVMPQARFVGIRRELSACLKSAKAQRLVNGLEEARAFCQKWAEGDAFLVQAAVAPGWLVMEYAAIEHSPDEFLAQLAQFTRAEGINPSILKAKVNTWQGASGAYIPPAQLTAQEMEFVQAAQSAASKNTQHG